MKIVDIVLIHGVLMNPVEMLYLKKQLTNANFTVHSLYYPSARRDVATNTEILQQKINKLKLENTHIVAHSLGGLMTMHLLSNESPTKYGRIVMLGSPLNGSYIAKRFMQWPMVNQLLKNSIDTGLDGNFPFPLKHYDIGMIAGKTEKLGVGALVGGLPEDSDGTVMVSETKHSILKDHIVINNNHTGLLFSKEAANLTVRFLNTGSFKK